jgi:hypothetical protein
MWLRLKRDDAADAEERGGAEQVADDRECVLAGADAAAGDEEAARAARVARRVVRDAEAGGDEQTEDDDAERPGAV